MEFHVNGLEADYAQWALTAMNYGQFQRCKGHQVLNYEISWPLHLFLEHIADYFEEFRQGEIADNDSMGFPEFVLFKKLGWPDLNTLVENHKELLKDLIKFNEYEILELICQNQTENKPKYSINSLDHVEFNRDEVFLKGRCFAL